MVVAFLLVAVAFLTFAKRRRRENCLTLLLLIIKRGVRGSQRRIGKAYFLIVHRWIVG
jgi:hypothetical protein